MKDVVHQLGTLYDDLAKLQADAKIAPFSDTPLGRLALYHKVLPKSWSPFTTTHLLEGSRRTSQRSVRR